MKLNAKELRDVDEKEIADKLKSIKRRPLCFILENIYDTYNIGGLFRLADALAIEKMYICGESEIPPNSKIKKASIGTYKVVPWEYKKTAKEAIKDYRDGSAKFLSRVNSSSEKSSSSDTNSRKNFSAPAPLVIAVEQHQNSISYQKADYSMPLALVMGNESYGVTEETLKYVDKIVEIPMWGINKSLNVIVSAAIVSYWVVSK
jgi:23S rRNA (guanosine2251-2'-O)-methyltransferase